MDRIPVSFNQNGVRFSGYFRELSGAGTETQSMWHLMDEKNFFNGTLRLVTRIGPLLDHPVSGKNYERLEWFFDVTPKTKDMEVMTGFFADLIMAWYE